jgi:hypothetical protein
MAKKLHTSEYYDKEGNLLRTETIEIDVPTDEELIKEKQDELLKIYSELQALIAGQNNG